MRLRKNIIINDEFVLKPLLEDIYSLSKRIIEINYKDEINLLYPVWMVMKEHLSKWKEINPEGWSFSEPKNRLMASMGFAHPSEMPNMAAPGIIAMTAGVLWNISSIEYKPEEKDIERIIDDCSKIFKISSSLTDNLKEFLVPLCMKEMPNVLKRSKKAEIENKGEKKLAGKVIESKPDAVKEEAHARVWTLGTDDPKNGHIISKREYDEIMKKKERTPLLIIKTNGFKNLYVYGNDKNLSQLLYDLLEYVLRNRGSGGTVLNLLENVWKSNILAKELDEELKKAKKEHNEKSIKMEIYAKTGHIRKAVSELNNFLREHFNIELKTLQKSQYKFTRPLDYYLIEIIY